MQIPYTNTAIYEWGHDKFIEKGDSYADQILLQTKKKQISVFERMDEQEKIVSELAECSKELSDFIKSQMDIEDVVLYRENREG